MVLEIKTVPAVYVYAFYWVLMMLFALSPFLWERQLMQAAVLSLSLVAVALLLAQRIKAHCKTVTGLSISLSLVEVSGGVLIVVMAVVTGFYISV